MATRPLRLLLVLGALALPACSEAPPANAPRHLILVTVDTLRADHLSAWGARHATSDAAGAQRRGSAPGFTLDELAAQGLRFEQAFAPLGMTFPSLASLMTGRTPLENGTLENAALLDAEARTLAEELAAHGFRCAAFTTNKLLVRGSGLDQGFEQFWNDAGERRDELALDAARAWLAAQDLARGPRLFLWVHLMGPHLPYQPPATGGVDFATLFADPSYAGPVDGSRESLDGPYARGELPAPTDLAQGVALYDGEVARIDQLVSRFGRFLAGAEAGQPRDLLAESLLVLAADHGEELAQRHGYWGHSKSVYSSVLHVPLFVRHPASVAPGVVHEPLAMLAVHDALLAWLGLPAPRDALARVLEPRGPVFGQWRASVFSVCDGRWRLVWNPEGVEPDDPPAGPYPIPRLALYDRESDPLELVDRAQAEPQRAEALRARIEAWLAGQPRARAPAAPDAERRDALRDLGYAGGEERRASERVPAPADEE